MVRYQVLLGLDTYDTEAIAINKVGKFNFRYSTIYLVLIKSWYSVSFSSFMGRKNNVTL